MLLESTGSYRKICSQELMPRGQVKGVDAVVDTLTMDLKGLEARTCGESCCWHLGKRLNGLLGRAWLLYLLAVQS